MLEELLKSQNITGDLAKFAKGEEVEVPDGKDAEEYKKELVDKWTKEREEFNKSKLEPYIQERVKVKADELFPATINPIRNALVSAGLFSPEEVKDKNPKDLIPEIAKMIEKAKADSGKSKSETEKEYIRKLEESQNKLIEINTQFAAKEAEYNSKLEENERVKQESLSSYILDQEFTKSIGNIKSKLVGIDVNGLSLLFKMHLDTKGYKLEVEDNKVIPKMKEGQAAISLHKNKNITDIEELLLEIADVENLLLKSHVEKDLNPGKPGAGRSLAGMIG